MRPLTPPSPSVLSLPPPHQPSRVLRLPSPPSIPSSFSSTSPLTSLLSPRPIRLLLLKHITSNQSALLNLLTICLFAEIKRDDYSPNSGGQRQFEYDRKLWLANRLEGIMKASLSHRLPFPLPSPSPCRAVDYPMAPSPPTSSLLILASNFNEISLGLSDHHPFTDTPLYPFNS